MKAATPDASWCSRRTPVLLRRPVVVGVGGVCIAAASGHQLPPRGVTILAGFFALTVGAVALRGLTALAGNPQIQGFNDIRDATSETIALTLGLIAGAVPAAAIGAYRRRQADQASGT